MTIFERFERKIHKLPDDVGGCWIWFGARDKDGYGRMGCFTPTHYSTIPVTRVAYMLYFEWPGDMLVCHRCDVTSCANPDHLFLGTQKDNLNDMRTKGRSKCGLYLKNKTHCVHGHEFTKETTAIGDRGRRSCLICIRARVNKYYRLNKEKERERKKISYASRKLSE